MFFKLWWHCGIATAALYLSHPHCDPWSHSALACCQFLSVLYWQSTIAMIQFMQQWYRSVCTQDSLAMLYCWM